VAWIRWAVVGEIGRGTGIRLAFTGRLRPFVLRCSSAAAASAAYRSLTVIALARGEAAARPGHGLPGSRLGDRYRPAPLWRTDGDTALEDQVSHDGLPNGGPSCGRKGAGPNVAGRVPAQAVVSNAATQILMRQAPQAIDLVADTFALTAGEARRLLTADRGEALLLSGSHRVGFHTVASQAEHRLASTDPGFDNSEGLDGLN